VSSTGDRGFVTPFLGVVRSSFSEIRVFRAHRGNSGLGAAWLFQERVESTAI
jgi:hypothetical protein